MVAGRAPIPASFEEPSIVSLSSSRLASVMALLVLLALASPAAAAPDVGTGQPVVPVAAGDEVRLVVHGARDAGTAVAAAEDLAATVGGETVLEIETLDVEVVAVPAEEAGAALARLAAQPGVEHVEVDGVARAFSEPAPRTPNDPRYGEQWGPVQVEAPRAWGHTTGGAGVVIAVLDTGVEGGHEDLTANVLPGYDVFTRTSGPERTDPSGHGTHVAGIAAARADNGRGIAGLCWSCGILPVRVLDANGRAPNSVIAAGIEWAIDSGAHVINLSLGSPTDSLAVREAVERAERHGVVVVAAAGNGNTTGREYPAAYPSVVGVAASTTTDARWVGTLGATGSNHGPWVSVAAPGVSILSTTRSTLLQGSYGRMTGTSMATPHVAGAVGLALAANPALTPAQVRSALAATSVPLSYVAHGRLDAAALLARVAHSAPGAPRSVRVVGGDRTATVTWTAPTATGNDPITGYSVSATPADGGPSVIVAVGATTTQATLSGLRNGIAHAVTVRAVNRYGTGSAGPGALLGRPLGFDGDPRTTQRIVDGDPTATAVAVSQRRFRDVAGTSTGPAARHAVLSRDDAFPDSLAGAPLSAGGPLLFTRTGALPTATAGELRRVLPAGATVYLLGGEAAIGAGVAGQVAGLGYRVVRLAGPSRVETALRVADEVRRLHPARREVLVARAYGAPDSPTSGWADSVTGGAYGAAAGIPVVLTPTDLGRDGRPHPALAAWLDRDRPSRSVVLGGDGAVGDAVATRLPNPARVSGAERTETAREVAVRLWGAPTTGPRRHVVINGFDGLGWAHGLAVAGLAADARAPLLMVTPQVPPATAALMGACGAPQVDALLVGHSGAIPDATVRELERLDGARC
jgi:subtilisin family serine protease